MVRKKEIKKEATLLNQCGFWLDITKNDNMNNSIKDNEPDTKIFSD